MLLPKQSASEMASSSEHASIDVQILAASLRTNIETLSPMSEDCCIYRVPQRIRCLNESAFAPKAVSIGPLHHGKPELKFMEEHKRRYLKHFLQRTKVSIEDSLTLIKDNEVRLRSCYAETIELKSDEFVRMIFVDAVFVIVFFLLFSNPDLISDDDYIYRRPRVDVWPDFLLVENQLPFFILNDLFPRAYYDKQHSDDGLTFMKLIKQQFKTFSLLEGHLEHQENLIESHFSKAKHLLDLLRLCLQPPQLTSPPNTANSVTVTPEPQNIPTLREIHQAGVKFKPESQNNLLDITFGWGILNIPLLKIYTSTEGILCNLLAFEAMHGDSHYINDYVLMMSHLINTVKDVELLVQKGVIKNWLEDSEAVSTLFHDLGKHTHLFLDAFQYSDLVDKLNKHCNITWNKSKATLKQDYFNTPWASISVVAAAILLLVSIIQTVCSIIAL